ncbi:unnamed protein product [Mytilus coruscus]|uniref:Uncharacterized protein n=1 Tax=Mytilus coruscus TaxID=42192 RepID=A0A6J8D806_MYTCO|nr:unnamed protein product [Mytilus coruscus]
MYLRFFIRDYVNRSNVEEKLISLRNSPFVALHGDKKYTFTLFKNVEALEAENYLSTITFLQRCFLKTTKTNIDAYVYSYVNRLMVCKQIELEHIEFIMRFFTLTVLSNQIDLDYDEYIIMPSGKARICLETFRRMFKEDKPSVKDVWEIIQMTCTCTSLVGLVMTFTTYCAFPILRTLPGKNNICLVFAMFHGHALIQFILYGSRPQKACMIIDTFLPMSAFSKIVSVLNALQGVLIFWSFICNKRVFNLYLNSCTSRLSKTTKNRAIEAGQRSINTEMTTIPTHEETK